MSNEPTRYRLGTNKPSLHRTQGGSIWLGASRSWVVRLSSLALSVSVLTTSWAAIKRRPTAA